MSQSNEVQVVVPLPLAEPFSYKVPEKLKLDVGDVVQVPFGNTKRRGVVWSKQSSGLEESKLKEVIKKLDAPALPTNTIKFIDWVADYNLSSRGAVFAMVTSVNDALKPPKPVIGYRIGDFTKLKMTKAREKVVAFLKDGGTFTAPDLAKEVGVSASVIKKMAQEGALEEVDMGEILANPYKEVEQPPKLSNAQNAAAKILRKKVEDKKYSATVLDGVTGSGKTEVYFEAIKAAMDSGKQALVLLPEIVLTTQLIERFKKRFGFAPTEWHSGLTPAKRRKNWRSIAKGKTNLIVGARSALFLPYPNLGLIIVDEEHEGAYKQEEGVIYNGRDMAVVRANIESIPIVLASATPSIESVVNVSMGKYEHLSLPERHGFAVPPIIDIVDVRNEKLDSQHWLSQELKESMVLNIERGQQTLLYLNRRGYAPLTLCRNCGFRYKCSQCSAWLVKHKHANFLQCHHCGHTENVVKECPECKTENSMAECGPGVERIEEEVREMLPQARIAVMTSDTTSKPSMARELITSILEGKVDIIIGTQMVTKGHHFPNLTLVGIVDADLGLEGGDLRAAEKTYQVLHQVAGRAGREDKAGRAIIQSYMPEHDVMQALLKDDRDAFVQSEIGARQVTHLPPFGKLAGLIISSKNEQLGKRVAQDLARVAPRGAGVEILGPAPAPLSLLRGYFRFRILVKTEKQFNIQELIRSWTKQVKIPSNVRLKIDIDPYSFM